MSDFFHERVRPALIRMFAWFPRDFVIGLARFFRLFQWLVFTAILCALVFYERPSQIPVYIDHLAKITTAAYIAYWVDVTLYSSPWAQAPHGGPPNPVTAARIIARALIFIGCAYAMGALG